jgi:hypothetical protein
VNSANSGLTIRWARIPLPSSAATNGYAIASFTIWTRPMSLIGRPNREFHLPGLRDGGRSKEMTLTGVEFVRRFSRLLLPAGFTKIRHYGLLDNNAFAPLGPARLHSPSACPAA